MRITPATELYDRIRRLQAEMAAADHEAVLLLQNSDLFYFTGSIQQGVLYIPVDGEPLYLVRKEYGRARMESGLKQVVPLKSPKELPGLVAEHGLPLPKRAGMELDVVPVETFQRFAKVLPGCEMVGATHQIRTVRAIKSDYEIGIMKDAALQVDKVFRRAKEVIRTGMTDLELAAELEYTARRDGHQGVTRMRGFNAELFYGHIFSGADSAAPAYLDAPLGGMGVTPAVGQGASYKTIKAFEPICVDFAGAFDGYLVDQTRILCIGGLPEQLCRAYDDMVRIQNRLLEIARPGVTWGAVYDDCHRLACELGYVDHFMGNKGAQVSFIGHGIGVEIDEYPFIARGFNDQVLQEDMTFAFEPKVVFAGLGAVGIENTFRLGSDGPKHITFSDQALAIL
jgi:Xaa-Pro dipeptidase